MVPKRVRALAVVLLTAAVAALTVAALTVAALTVAALAAASAKDPRPPATPFAYRQSGSNSCESCHRKTGDQSVDLFSKSTHSKRGLSCDGCHGGDAKAADRQAAHRVDFVGRPDDARKLAMCGGCHAAELSTFKKSLHFPERSSAPRMTCVECHGAHTVGSVSRDFSFALYCVNCHGLEYLPALPAEFQKTLTMLDEQKEALAKLESSGRKPSDELIAIRKEIRHGVAEIIHATNLRGGVDRLPQILKRGDDFKSAVERELK